MTTTIPLLHFTFLVLIAISYYNHPCIQHAAYQYNYAKQRHSVFFTAIKIKRPSSCRKTERHPKGLNSNAYMNLHCVMETGFCL